jgi:glycosyltransferase involved in cell wall biosynthesis/O-antigen ligase
MRAHRQRLQPVAFALAAAAASTLGVLAAYKAHPLIPLAAMALLVACWAAVTRPLWVFYAGIVLIPLGLNTLSIGQVAALSPARTLFGLSALGWVVRRLMHGRVPVVRHTALGAPFAILLIAVLPGVLLAQDRWLVLKLLASWLMLFFIYQMLVDAGGPDAVRRMMIALALTGAVSGVMAILTTHGGTSTALVNAGQNAVGRATGEFLSPNALGILLAIATPGAIVLALRGPSLIRPAASLAVVLSLAGLLLTLSRAAFLATAVGSAVMLVWRPVRRTAIVGVTLAVVAAVALGTSISAARPIDLLTQRLEAVHSSAVADPRVTVWHEALAQFADHPVFGVGGNNFQSQVLGTESPDPEFRARSATGVEYSRFTPHAHNIVLNFAAELGLVGLAALAWVAATLVRVLVRAYRHARERDRGLVIAVAAALTAVGFEGFFDNPLHENTIATLVVALAAGAVMLERAESRPPAVEAVSAGPVPVSDRAPTAAAVPAPALPPAVDDASPTPAPAAPNREPALPILFISSHAICGGAELQFARRLEAIGPDWVSGVVTLGGGPLVDRLAAKGATVKVIPASGALGIAAAGLRLRRLLRRHPPALVHADGLRAALAASIGAARTGVPVLWLKVDRSRDGWLANAIASRCRMVVGVSDAVTATFQPRVRDRVRVVPNGVPEYRFNATHARERAARLADCAADAPILIHLSRLFRAKGHLELVEALPAIRARFTDVRLLFLAPGVEDPSERAYLEEIERRSRELGVDDAVRFGFGEPEPVEVLAGADVVAVPSMRDPVSGWREGFGLVGVEAMRVQTPVVAYDDDALREVLGECARFVRTGDRVALGEAVSEVLGSPDLRARMVACGGRRASRYDESHVIAELERCYRECSPPPRTAP